MNPVQHILIGLVKLYRWTLSPAKFYLFGPSARCRFTPSCSAYACEALKIHGVFRGSWLAVRRLCRCHPWGDWGPDPVPPRAGEVHAHCGQTKIEPAGQPAGASPDGDPEIAGQPAHCR